MRPRIWIPEVSEPTAPSCTIPVHMAGIFHVTLRDTKSGHYKFSGSFPNLITDNFLNAFGMDANTNVQGASHWLYRLYVGSGSTPPTTTDAWIEGPIGNGSVDDGSFPSTTTFVTGSDPAPLIAYWAFTQTRYFGPGVSTGSISELGWVSNAHFGNSGSFFDRRLAARALIKDPITGLPTTIVKSDDDELLVRYEYRTYVPTETSSLTTTFGPTTHEVKILPVDINLASAPFNNQWGKLHLFGLGEVFITNTAALNWYSRIITTLLNTGSNPSPLYNGGNGAAIPGKDGPYWTSTSIPVDSGSFLPYTTGTFYRDLSLAITPRNSAANNLPSGILGLAISTGGSFYSNTMALIKFSPPVPKPDTHLVKFTVRWSWARSGSM